MRTGKDHTKLNVKQFIDRWRDSLLSFRWTISKHTGEVIHREEGKEV
jgi:hypothetical protein